MNISQLIETIYPQKYHTILMKRQTLHRTENNAVMCTRHHSVTVYKFQACSYFQRLRDRGVARNQTPPLIVTSSTTPRVTAVVTERVEGERARYNTFRAILPSSSGPVLAEAYPAVDGNQREDEASDIPLSDLNRNSSKYKTGKSSIKC